MGKVYKATAGDGPLVALKLVKEDLARDETFRSRFWREARIAQTVRNAHVIPVRDTGEQDGIPYLATPFVEGVSLDQKLGHDGRLDLPTTVGICAQVGQGLQALWDAGMVHRDVKPANILVDLAGRSYITDFGLAKVSGGTVLTRPGQALGSMDYMSPEQIRGEPVTGASDVYSLGCVAFECLIGRPPFGDRDGLRVLWAHLQDDPPDPTTGLAGVVPALGPAILRALEKDRAKRPQSAGEYARLLYEAAGLVAPAN